MNATSALNSILNNSSELKTIFPSIKLMTLPKEGDTNYISFSKIKSICSNTLDNFLREEATYTINCYAARFEDLNLAEEILIGLLNGQVCDNRIMSITSIEEEQNIDIKKYIKKFTIEIK